jgi:hypothetical protein
VPIGGETSSTPTLGNIGGEIVGTR